MASNGGSSATAINTDRTHNLGWSDPLTTMLDLGPGPQGVNSGTAVDPVGNQATSVVPIRVRVPPRSLPCTPCATTPDLQAAIGAARLGDTVLISTALTVYGLVTVSAVISLMGGAVHSWPDVTPALAAVAKAVPM